MTKINIKALAQKTPKSSPEKIAHFLEEEEKDFREASIRCLRVGNLQITHIIPEITALDLDVEFDTSLFLQRCKWAKKKLKFYYTLKNMNTGFYIYGETGSGKTVFLKAKALDVAKNGDHTKAEQAKKNGLKYNGEIFNKDFVKFVNYGKLMQDISKENFIYKSYILAELQKCTHLFIDDIGTESGTTWHEQIITEVLDNRLFKNDKDGIAKTTNFSSNKKPEQLPYHPRVIRRFNDIAKVIQVANMDKTEPAPAPLKGNPSES